MGVLRRKTQNCLRNQGKPGGRHSGEIAMEMTTVLAIGAIVVAALIGVLDKVVFSQNQRGKVVILVVYLVSLGVTVAAVWIQNFEQQRAQSALREELTEAKEERACAEHRLSEVRELTMFIHAIVGDLGKLNELTGEHRYFVRIAAGKTREELEGYLRSIEKRFKGAKSSGLVTIREPVPPSSWYYLVFGQQLDLVAAEVFKRLADAHRFPPQGDVAAIVPEPE